jgi:hypothetical protein
MTIGPGRARDEMSRRSTSGQRINSFVSQVARGLAVGDTPLAAVVAAEDRSLTSSTSRPPAFHAGSSKQLSIYAAGPTLPRTGGQNEKLIFWLSLVAITFAGPAAAQYYPPGGGQVGARPTPRLGPPSSAIQENGRILTFPAPRRFQFSRPHRAARQAS